MMSRTDIVNEGSGGASGQGQGDRIPVTGVATRQSLIHGRVLDGGKARSGVHVRLLDDVGDFVAEVVSGTEGTFRFYAAPGLWTVRALAPGARGARTVQVSDAQVELELRLAAVPARDDAHLRRHR
jgi:hypothetical protein